jgi:pimeloyl-ACP methyl ester carboxylesterase
MNTVTSKDGTSIAYDVEGSGPVLVMVSGAFSYRKYPPSVQLAKLLSPHFTVFNYDRRGRGDSGDTKPYAVEREVEDLEALINAAGGSAFVWGLSSGAVLALEGAARGLRIAKLALQEPPFVVQANDRRPPSDMTEHLNGLIANDRRGEAVKYFMTKGMGAPSFVIGLMHIMPGVWSRLKAVANTLPYDAALLDGRTSGNPLDANEWRSVQPPTLVMAGSESPEFLINSAQALASVLPDARMLTQKGLGHTKKLSTKVIAPALIEFFEGDAGGT